MTIKAWLSSDSFENVGNLINSAIVLETEPNIVKDEANAPIINTPIRFPIAHNATACLGFKALVVMEVAIALGPSVHPFMNTSPYVSKMATIAQGYLPNKVKKEPMSMRKNSSTIDITPQFAKHILLER